MDIASVVNSDEWRGYNGLVDFDCGYFCVNNFKDEFARVRVHIKRIEGFWDLQK